MDEYKIFYLVKTLSARYSMPNAERTPSSRAEQMRSWLVDPILHSEAAAWFRYHGYEPVYDNEGTPFDFTLPDEEVE